MSIGERLREERERLAFTQPAFAGLAETTKKSQIDYEKDLTQPKAGYLAAIAKVGADVQYIVTGVRSAQALSNEEALLLKGFREMDEATRKRTLAFVLAGESSPNVPKYSVDFGNAQIGQQVTGDVTNSELSFTFGQKKK